MEEPGPSYPYPSPPEGHENEKTRKRENEKARKRESGKAGSDDAS
jgi:hypothetical protein